MKIPNGIEKLTVINSDIPLGPYPSLGFVPISDAQLGNGDYFGLYWPLGRENDDPIVCDMLHDEWALEPSFSCVDKFIQWLDLNDWQRGDEEINDQQLSSVIFSKAKVLYSSTDIDGAIELLNKACSNLPEVSEYWFALYSQQRRIGDIEKSANAALKAINSNWAFGLPSDSILRALRNPQFQEMLKDDPLMQRIGEFELHFGGVKENANYPVMYECVQEYFKRDQFVEGLMLYQNYGYMMHSETVSFQQRYNFKLDNWRLEYSELCLRYLGNSRIYP